MLVCCLFGLIAPALAQRHLTQSINANWLFHQGELSPAAGQPATADSWQPVPVPHTWNARDVRDDEPGYYRGVGYYKKTLSVPATWQEKELYLFFEGAAQVAEVFVNGQKAGSHTGSYSAFRVPIKAFLKFKAGGSASNEIVVKVDNSHRDDVPPLSADFTFFGGLYRDVYLEVVNPMHFDLSNYGSRGVFLTTPKVSAAQASVTGRGALESQAPQAGTVLVRHQLLDQAGQLVSQHQQKLKIPARGRVPFTFAFPPVVKPQLWSPESPYLYTVLSQLLDAKTGQLLDETSNPLGLRWFRFDPALGFFLNGQPYKLLGTSRHQDYAGLGNALPDELQVRDVQLLKDMGGNFLRVAHYPQDPAVLAACDRLGLLTSVETPIVNRITESEGFRANCLQMQTEMIRQNYNHPSVIIWAYMNEVLLRPPFGNDAPRQEIYFQHVTQLAQELESLTRREDPTRYTLIPNHGNFKLYTRIGLTRIPQLVGWNLYQGWYGDQLSGFAEYLDQHHRELPDKPLLVTEYGADADPRLRADKPERFDKSLEYTTLYHATYLEAILQRPFVAGAVVWNLADFSSEERQETDPHVNNKGLLTLDRQPKDGYYFYQAHLLKKPFVRIGSRQTTLRSGLATRGAICEQAVEVFTNQPAVTLYLNSRLLATVRPTFGIARFQVPFEHGLNQLEARATAGPTTISDQVPIQFRVVPARLADPALPFTELNVSLGDQRYYYDQGRQQVWLPEKPYAPGSYGYVGGRVFALKNRARQSYGSDKNVLGTEDDAIYATQRVGLEAFRLDVPAGRYEVTLHFAELLSDAEQQVLAYNLDNGGPLADKAQERAFNVRINGQLLLENFGTRESLPVERAFSTKTTVQTQSNQGLNIVFEARKGEAILNGIQVQRLQ